eukprot:373963-Rhodomonas_salina.1
MMRDPGPWLYGQGRETNLYGPAGDDGGAAVTPESSETDQPLALPPTVASRGPDCAVPPYGPPATSLRVARRRSGTERG